MPLGFSIGGNRTGASPLGGLATRDPAAMARAATPPKPTEQVQQYPDGSWRRVTTQPTNPVTGAAGSTRTENFESPAIAQLRARAEIERQPVLDSYGNEVSVGGTTVRTGGGGSGGGSGSGDSEADWRARMAYEAELAAAAEQRRRGWATEDRTANQAFIDAMLNRAEGGGGGGVEFDKAGYDAAFARAKDQQAKVMGGALAALKDAMSARGLSGSGIEAQRFAEVIGGGAGNLGEFNREAAIQEFGARERAQERGLTRRGQTLGLIPSLAGLLNQGLRY